MWPDLAQGAEPALTRQIGHVTERQRAYGVPPVRRVYPEAEKGMPAFLEGKHALGVIGELACQEDAQTVAGCRIRRTDPKATVQLHFVVQGTDRAVEPERLRHLIARPVGVEPSPRLTQRL